VEEKKVVGEGVIPLLKSNLQKCIRRQLKERAMRTARLLMDLDMSLFMRRLSIIMLEDVVLHECFPILLWLTAAVSKGFIPPTPMMEWLMGVVEWMCSEGREDYWTHSIDNTTPLLSTKEHKIMYKRVDGHSSRDMIYSLFLRQAYGALPGDQAMITHFASLVESGVIIPSTTPIKRIDLGKITPLPLGQVEPCSADFHCFPQVVATLFREKKQVYTEQQIKNAIWHHSSRYNKRVILPEEEKRKLANLLTIWQSIKGRLWYLQKDYIHACENKYNYANRLV
jgi:hypothetical protein